MRTTGGGEDITLAGDQREVRHQKAQPDQGPHGGEERERERRLASAATGTSEIMKLLKTLQPSIGPVMFARKAEDSGQGERDCIDCKYYTGTVRPFQHYQRSGSRSLQPEPLASDYLGYLQPGRLLPGLGKQMIWG